MVAVSDHDAKPAENTPTEGAPAATPPPSPPGRPQFASGLPQREELRTPTTIAIAHGTVFASAVAFIVPTAIASTRWRDLQKSLRKTLTDKASDYSAEDIRHAVDVTLVGVALIALLLVLLEIASVRSLAKRQMAGRTMLLILTVINLPAMVIVSAFRDGGLADLSWTALQGLMLVLTLMMALLPVTKDWLQAKPPLAMRPLSGFGVDRPT